MNANMRCQAWAASPKISGYRCGPVKASPRGRHRTDAVEALDERSAIAEVAKQFHITPARRYQIMVTRSDPGTASEKKPGGAI
jgi:hypothetical protein